MSHVGAYLRRRIKRGAALVVPSYVSSVAAVGNQVNFYPGAYLSTDFIVLVVANAAAMATPPGWTLVKYYNWWTGDAYHMGCWARIIGVSTSVTVPGNYGGQLLVYRGAQKALANPWFNSAMADTTLVFDGSTFDLTSPLNRVLAVACDRDPVAPTVTGALYTPRLQSTGAAFGFATADRACGAVAQPPSVTFNQSAASSFMATGFFVELRPEP